MGIDQEGNRKTNPSKEDSNRNNRKTSGKGSKKKYYEWDYTHNDIEVYNNRGIHLGSMDPVTGEM